MKVWFITGASRGFGRVWAEAALKRGDKVAATARNLASIAGLKEKYGENALTLELDVTKPDQVRSAVAQAHAHFGRLDIVLNNAGYSLVGTIEEASANDVRALYETNIFGTLSVIQAALPLLRKQGGGHILGVSSGLGHVTMPVIGYYCSSKWAFEAIHESLAAEIKPFGIKVTIIEPGAYATEFGSPESLKFAAGLDIYAELKNQLFDGLKTWKEAIPQQRQRPSSKSWTRRTRRYGSISAATTCPGYVPPMPNGWQPGKRGSPSPIQLKGKRM